MRRRLGVSLAVCLVLLCGPATKSAAPRFYPDDPIWTDDDRAFDATNARPIEDTNGYDSS